MVEKSKIKNADRTKMATLIIFAPIFVLGSYLLPKYISRLKNAVVSAASVKPEKFTELYFEDSINLPKKVMENKEYNFTFTIHNLEGDKVDYPYIVYLQSETKRITLDEGNVAIPDYGYKTITEAFGPLKMTDIKIVVILSEKNQQIDFWLKP